MVTAKHRQIAVEHISSKDLSNILSESDFDPWVSDLIVLAHVGVINASPTASNVM